MDKESIEQYLLMDYNAYKEIIKNKNVTILHKDKYQSQNIKQNIEKKIKE